MKRIKASKDKTTGFVGQLVTTDSVEPLPVVMVEKRINMGRRSAMMEESLAAIDRRSGKLCWKTCSFTSAISR